MFCYRRNNIGRPDFTLRLCRHLGENDELHSTATSPPGGAVVFTAKVPGDTAAVSTYHKRNVYDAVRVASKAIKSRGRSPVSRRSSRARVASRAAIISPGKAPRTADPNRQAAICQKPRR